MSYLDNMIEKYDAGRFVIGYFDSGHIASCARERNPSGYFPFAIAVDCIQDPTNFAPVFRKAMAGDKGTIGFYEGVNVGVLEITETGVRAEVDLPNEEYKDEMTFAEFAIALNAWEKAWAAAQMYKMNLTKG